MYQKSNRLKYSDNYEVLPRTHMPSIFTLMPVNLCKLLYALVLSLFPLFTTFMLFVFNMVFVIFTYNF